MKKRKKRKSNRNKDQAAEKNQRNVYHIKSENQAYRAGAEK